MLATLQSTTSPSVAESGRLLIGRSIMASPVLLAQLAEATKTHVKCTYLGQSNSSTLIITYVDFK